MAVRIAFACLLSALLLGASLESSFAQAQTADNADSGAGAAASDSKGGGKHRGGGKQQAQEQKSAPRADEKASHKAIESLPDQTYDPWHNMR
jgi:hypothetical protein